MSASRRPIRSRVLAAAVVLAVLLLFGGRVFDFLGRQMLYPAPAFAVPSPPPVPLEEVRLELGSGGGEVIGWAFEHPPDAERDRPRTAVVFFHDFERLGVHFLAVDYPGYGRSRGTPSEASLVAAGEAGLAWLERRFPDSPKAVAGWSLGAAVAVQVARRQGARVDRLALLSAWDDLTSLAAAHFPRWLVSMGLPDRYDSLAAAPEIAAPTLLIHGTRDQIIPIVHGERLYAAFGERARMVRVPDAGHNDLLARPVVWEELARFLR
jgi:pimeloyl-ACP methyl ester carboxylesterase